jgi:hypothetical protein
MDFETLIQLPESLRDDAWEARFLDGILTTKVVVEAEEPKPGPDGWPYLHLRTGGEGQEPFHRVVKWASGRGIGLVVNAHKMVPDYVFTYGMLWNFIETGRFVAPMNSSTPPDPGPQVAAEEVILQPDQDLMAGAPTEKFLPPYVRAVLREFLIAQGFPRPRILVLSSSRDFSQTDLVFSLESLNDLAASAQPVLAEALSWFLPIHYRLVLGSERNLPAFVDL